MFRLDRAVEKYQRKLTFVFLGTPMEVDIPTMVALYREKMAQQAIDLPAAKAYLNDAVIAVGFHGFYMNVIRLGRKFMDDGLAGTPLKNAINGKIDDLVISTTIVKTTAQALVFVVLGVPLV